MGPAVLAALASGFVGMMVWFALIQATGWEIGFVAWGVGAGVGVATLWGAGRRGLGPGVVAVVVATFAILGGHYLVGRVMYVKAIREIAGSAYQERITFAGKLCAAQSEKEIRSVVAVHNYYNDDELGADEDPDPSSVTDEQIKSFHTQIKPEYEALLDGRPSREEFVDHMVDDIMDGISAFDILSEGVSLFTALWLILGVGTALKIAGGEEKS